MHMCVIKCPGACWYDLGVTLLMVWWAFWLMVVVGCSLVNWMVLNALLAMVLPDVIWLWSGSTLVGAGGVGKRGVFLVHWGCVGAVDVFGAGSVDCYMVVWDVWWCRTAWHLKICRGIEMTVLDVSLRPLGWECTMVCSSGCMLCW